MDIPRDYEERVYAGILGKIIGVYLGRPFENWSYESLTERFGEVSYYVHEELGKSLLVTDDDISGTFTFIRALEDNGYAPGLTPQQIGAAWLNYIIENTTVLWWGGVGVSTEHTAYARLKAGVPAPRSGSVERNGRVVAEQIGSQIFIDGWGMINPGDPERAADFAGRAASVSHDGEAIYGAQVVAALVAGAFVESNIDRLLDTAASLVPKDCTINRLMSDVREWRGASNDWRATRARLAVGYGYDKYTGGCPMVSNHGVILLALTHGDGDLTKSLTIANTAGWDTDCNSGNVGAILGVRNGLAGFDGGPDWRGPVADRLFLPTADGGRAISDAVRECDALVRAARHLRGLPPATPKEGARYHFSMPGSVQGFVADADGAPLRLENHHGALDLRFREASPLQPARAATATFTPPFARQLEGYGLVASPSLYAGQALAAGVQSLAGSPALAVNLFVRVYGADDAPETLMGPRTIVAAGEKTLLRWPVPDTAGQPIFEVGLEVAGHAGAASGALRLEWLTWGGAPRTTLGDVAAGSLMAPRAWIHSGEAGSRSAPGHDPDYSHSLFANQGITLHYQGEFGWRDYSLKTHAESHLCDEFGLLANVRGLRRYIALLACRDHTARLVEHYDEHVTVLAEAALPFELDRPYQFELESESGGRIVGQIDGARLVATLEPDRTRGAAGFTVRDGNAQFGPLRLEPLL